MDDILTKQKPTIALIRLFSTAGVFLIHLSYKFSGGGWLYNVSSHGQDGLWAYYFLTGYLVLGSYENSASAKEYWMKRIARVIPLYYFVLLVIYCLYRCGLIYNNVSPDPSAFTRAFFQLSLVIPSRVSYDWNSMYIIPTISNFLMLYCLIPLVSKWFGSFRRAATLFVCVLLAQPFLAKLNSILFLNLLSHQSAVVDPLWYHCLLHILPLTAAGFVLYYASKEDKPLTALALLLGAMVITQQYPEIYDIIRLRVVVICAILICIPLTVPTWISRIMDVLSKFTFPIFVCHAVIFSVMNRLIPDASAFFVAIVALTVSVIVHYLVEVPAAKLVKAAFIKSPAI